MDEIQKIVYEITDRCRRQKILANEMLAAFVAKAIILESPERFQLDKNLSADDIEELVSLSVRRLAKEDDPSLETLRLQVSFDSSYVEKQDELEKERADSKRKYTVIEQSICAVKLQHAKDVATMGQLHKLIIAALLTKTGQDPQSEVYQKEVAAALESVLPRANLHAFSSLPYADKRERMEDLFNYVLGIRLFNKSIGKGGVDLPDKVSESHTRIEDLFHRVDAELEEARAVVEEYAMAIEMMQRAEASADETLVASLKRVQDELTNRRQYLNFLESFEEELLSLRDRSKDLKRQHDGNMEDLRELVGRKTAVPKEKVYPLFENLAKLWVESKEIDQHTHALLGIFEDLLKFSQPRYVKQLNEELVERITSKAQGKGQAGEEAVGVGSPSHSAGEEGGEGQTEGKSVSGEKIEAALNVESSEAIHVYRSDNPEIANLVVNFGGFCPVTIVERNNLLLPGNPSLGYVLYKGRLNSFVSAEALSGFKDEPDRYIEGVLMGARKAPELINLLNLERYFPHNVLKRYLSNLDSRLQGLPQSVDADTQTPTHFVEKRIDPKYDWNEWSLRRKALQLANLHTKKTCSTQTNMSHFRRENETQVYLPKSGVTQTARERGTKPVKHLQYISGLRGHPDQEMKVVKVEVDFQ
uniref:Cilia- and flagella-associated protein 206 n=1 Tax=Guillardia theta TaxID=55529 RepID=A0A7S4M138_GUITH|mmetsp:Transcript_12772/g.44761  ORF Transcript_12772/g.44761 Transcript_12772/m.44761 type:complete len:644 (+) Transcript_12772:35-1966(+)